MLAGTGYWGYDRLYEQRQRDERARAKAAIAAAERRAHRALDKKVRILTDLVRLGDKLARAAKTTERQAAKLGGVEAFRKRVTRWAKQYNKLRAMYDNMA